MLFSIEQFMTRFTKLSPVFSDSQVFSANVSPIKKPFLALWQGVKATIFAMISRAKVVSYPFVFYVVRGIITFPNVIILISVFFTKTGFRTKAWVTNRKGRQFRKNFFTTVFTRKILSSSFPFPTTLFRATPYFVFSFFSGFRNFKNLGTDNTILSYAIFSRIDCTLFRAIFPFVSFIVGAIKGCFTCFTLKFYWRLSHKNKLIINNNII